MHARMRMPLFGHVHVQEIELHGVARDWMGLFGWIGMRLGWVGLDEAFSEDNLTLFEALRNVDDTLIGGTSKVDIH